MTLEIAGADAPLPPLPGDALLKLYNAQLPAEVLGPVMARAVSTLKPAERAHERDRFVLRAAGLRPPATAYGHARAIHARMGVLLTAFPGYLDAGTVDGCLGLVLVLCAMKVPSFTSVWRAFSR